MNKRLGHMETQISLERNRFAVAKVLASHQCGPGSASYLYSGYSGFPSPQKPTFDLICVNCDFQCTVYPISTPALERLDI